MPSTFPCSPVVRECLWKKTQIEKKIKIKKKKKIKQYLTDMSNQCLINV